MTDFRSYIQLIVPEYIPMALTTALVGYVLSNGAFPGIEFLILIVVFSCLVGAFNAFNAVADRDIDKINKPDRPVPSNSLHEKKAIKVAAVLYSAAFILAVTVNLTFLLIVIVSIIITASYSFPGIYLKKRFILGSLTVTFFYAILCALGGWSFNLGNPIPLAVISFLFILGLGLSISKDFMDVTGDKALKAYTVPVKLGRKNGVKIIITLLAISFIFLLFLISLGHTDQRFFFLLIFLPVFLYLASRFRKASSAIENNRIFNELIVALIILEFAIIALVLIMQ